MKAKGIFFCILSCLSFALAFAIAPLTYNEGGSNPIMLGYLRNHLTLPLLFLIMIFSKISFKITKKQFINLLILAIFGNAITTIILNISISIIDVGIAIPLFYSNPIFVFLCGVLIFKDKIKKSDFVALITVMLGIACFFIGAFADLDSSSNDVFFGLFLGLCSGITYAFYIVFIDRSKLKSENPFKIIFYVSLISGCFIYIYGLFTNEINFSNLTNQSWAISFAFATLCNIIGLTTLQASIKYINANTTALITTCEPFMSVVLAAIILGEAITISKVLACVFIFIGILILSLSSKNT